MFTKAAFIFGLGIGMFINGLAIAQLVKSSAEYKNSRLNKAVSCLITGAVYSLIAEIWLFGIMSLFLTLTLQ